MKKIFASFVAVTLLSCSLFAKNITIVKTNGGTLGYERVDESHTSDGHHSLSCLGVGSNACDWLTPPRIIAAGTIYELTDIQQNVETQMAEGELIGSYTIDNEISVSWNGIDMYNYELTITDNEED